MELFDAIANRRSIRKFTGEAVSCEQLIRIVDAGRLAASGNNRQPWEFIIINDAEIMRQIRIPDDHWSTGAAAYIAVVMDPESRWWIEDGAAAVQNMLLACTGLGLGGCWIEGYTLRNADPICAVLGIPENRKLFTLVVVGVPEDQPTKEKKSLDEVLFWQRFGQKKG